MSDYERLPVHRWMLGDAVRNEAYRRAIQAVVKPGDVVLDLGAGTGILSIFSAQAGARKVYAIERTGIAEVARHMVARNGFAEQIQVCETDLEDADLPEKVDVIVSEWMGGLGIDENLMAPLVIARRSWLKPSGRIIPARVTAFAAPTWIAGFEQELAHWRSRPHGVDMSLVAQLTASEIHATQAAVRPEDLFAPPQPLWTHDALTCSLEEADAPSLADLRFEATRSGKLLGLATWFEADMTEGQLLTNAVGAPDTHWGRVFFPLEEAVDVTAGTPIRVELGCYPSAPGTSEFAWSITVGDRPAERHDTRRYGTFPGLPPPRG